MIKCAGVEREIIDEMINTSAMTVFILKQITPAGHGFQAGGRDLFNLY